MTESCKDSNGDKWEIYIDKVNQWRWRRKASNGKIVGSSSEGYVNKADCIANMQRNGMKCSPV